MSGFNGRVVQDKSMALVNSTTVPRAPTGRHDNKNGRPSCKESCVALGSIDTSTASVRNTSTAGDSCDNSPLSAARYEALGCSVARAIGTVVSVASIASFHGIPNVVAKTLVHA